MCIHSIVDMLLCLQIQQDDERVGLSSTSSSGVEMIIWVKRVPVFFPSTLSDFSLLDALKEGYFSDLSVRSCDGQQVMEDGGERRVVPSG